MKKKRYLMKKKPITRAFIPPVYIPTFLGAKININAVGQDLLWPSMERIRK